MARCLEWKHLKIRLALARAFLTRAQTCCDMVSLSSIKIPRSRISETRLTSLSTEPTHKVPTEDGEVSRQEDVPALRHRECTMATISIWNVAVGTECRISGVVDVSLVMQSTAMSFLHHAPASTFLAL